MTVAESIKGNTVTSAALSGATWTNVLVPSDDVVDMTNSATGNYVILDKKDVPTEKLGTATIGESNTYTVDYAGNVKVKGNVTVNETKYNGTGALTLVADAEGKSAKLYAVTITIDASSAESDVELESTDSSLKISKGSNVTLTATEGYFTRIEGLDAGESLTIDNTAYVGGTMFTLSETVDAAAENITSIKMPATATSVTVPFATQIEVSAGNVKVNEVKFNGTGNLTLDATATGATLNTGTVNLSTNEKITASSAAIQTTN